MSRAERGFTLFEVLAAVAILGVLYSALVGWAMDGLRAEGSAKRRLEASLIADDQLAEIELGLDVGVTPALGEQEFEVGEFRVVVAVEPYDLRLPVLEAAGGPPTALLADLTSDRITPLRRIQVRVLWLDADLEFSVVRTSFALDPANLDTTALGPTDEAGGPAPEAGAGPDAPREER